jgi:hypothetical protein
MRYLPSFGFFLAGMAAKPSHPCFKYTGFYEIQFKPVPDVFEIRVSRFPLLPFP